MFQERCPPDPRTWQPFVVALHGAQSQQRAVVLADRFYERFGVSWSTRTTDRTGLSDYPSDEQAERLSQFPSWFLRALDERYLKQRVTQEARAATKQGFSLDAWPVASRAIIDHATDHTDLWGFRFDRRLAARLAPFALVALCLSLLYGVRRINPRRDLSAYPWMVLMPRGLVEVITAMFYVLATGFAVWGVARATCVFEVVGGDVPADLPADIDKGTWSGSSAWRVYGTVLEGVSVLLLVWAWGHLCWILRRPRKLADGGGDNHPSRDPRTEVERSG